VVVAVVVLAVLVLALLAVVARLLVDRRVTRPGVSSSVRAALDAAPPPDPSSTATRQIITIEILNPLELAGARGRWAGIAGALLPGLTRRMVHDEAVKLVERQLAAENVRADVRVHVIRPGDRAGGRPDQPPVV
jgi:hypothetical protein